MVAVQFNLTICPIINIGMLAHSFPKGTKSHFRILRKNIEIQNSRNSGLYLLMQGLPTARSSRPHKALP